MAKTEISTLGEFGSLGWGFILTIDNVAALAESAMNLRNGLVEGNLCHSLISLKGFKSFKGVRRNAPTV